MARRIHVNDLSPNNASDILGALERRAQYPPEIRARIVKPTPKRPKSKPWYVIFMQAIVYVVAYLLLGIGWCLEHIGKGICLLGKEMKDAARNID